MTVRVLVGDALTVLRTLESESVQVCVTSPPYYGLRDYGVEGQIGLETTPRAFLEALWAVFDEVRRVLRPDGLCFVNIGDSRSGSGKGPTGHNGIGDQGKRQGFTGAQRSDHVPAKNLYLIPQRFAIGMQERGWIVRDCVVWAKTSAMPESVRDRMTSAWEPIWMFAKSARYWYDAEAVRQPAATGDPSNVSYRANGKSTGRIKHMDGAPGQEPNHGFVAMAQNGDRRHDSGANLRNVWTSKKPVLRLRSDLTPEQRAYVLRRLADGIDRADHA